MELRTEHGNTDGFEIPAGRYWGAQTERSRRELPDGAANERMPREIIRAFGVLKRAAARANFDLLPERMNEEKCAAVFAAADEVIRGRLAEEFPLAVWQTGSGGKTNANVNEVIARRGSEMANEPSLCPDSGSEVAGEPLLSPEDVNLSQPPDGVFLAAAHIAAARAVEEKLLPAAEALLDVLARREDAAPWRGNIERDRDALRGALTGLCSLTLGGAEAPEGYAAAVAAEVAKQTGQPFVSAGSTGPGAGPLGGLLAAHGAMRSLAGDLMSIADALRAAPAVSRTEGADPALCEQLEIVAVQVMGNDAALDFAAAQEGIDAGEFLPVCAYNFLQSARLLSETIASFAAAYGNEEG